MSESLAPDIRCRVRVVGYAASSSVPLGQSVRVYAEFSDAMSGALINVSDVTFPVVQPGGPSVVHEGEEVTLGVWACILPLGVAGVWSVGGQCATPTVAVDELTLRVHPSGVNEAAASSPLLVTEDLWPITLSDGSMLVAQRIPALPAATDTTGAMLIAAQGGQSKSMSWAVLEAAAQASGSSAGNSAGATAGATAGAAAAQPFAEAAEAARDQNVATIAPVLAAAGVISGVDPAAINAAGANANAASASAAAAAVSAASANALNPAIHADAGSTRGLVVVDDAGFIALEVPLNGSQLAMAWGALAVSAGVTTLTDAAGAVTLRSKVGGGALLTSPTLVSPIFQSTDFSGVTFGGATFASDSRTDIVFAIADPVGWIGWAIKSDGSVLSAPVTSTPSLLFTDAEIDGANARALAVAAQTVKQYETLPQRPVFGINHFLTYGQSLSTGQEGWPALSTAAKYGNLMLGDSVRPVGRATADWVPVGSATLQPLVATVDNNNGTGSLIDAAAQAVLPVGQGNLGETIGESAVNGFRKSWLDDMGVASDTTRLFVNSSCGVSNRTLELLSKGATIELFNRLRDCATLGKAAATAAGKSYGIPAIMFLQGEHNYGDNGGTLDKAAYKALLKQFRADFQTDVVEGIAGQTRKAAIITYQTGASYTADTIAVGMAQWELSEEEPAWYLAAPVYPVTDKGGHLDPNGYRWLGAQFAKVMHRVLSLGQRWRPLCPLASRITLRGQKVLVPFHVPVAPLVWDTPYVGATLTPTDYAQKGFSASDDNGDIPLTAAIVADTVVELTLSRPTVGAVSIQYARRTTFSGNGNLRDSDPTVAETLYEYTAGNGQYAAADIPALVGKPYPLWNWCVAFNLPASAG